MNESQPLLPGFFFEWCSSQSTQHSAPHLSDDLFLVCITSGLPIAAAAPVAIASAVCQHLRPFASCSLALLLLSLLPPPPKQLPIACFRVHCFGCTLQLINRFFLSLAALLMAQFGTSCLIRFAHFVCQRRYLQLRKGLSLTLTHSLTHPNFLS